MIYVSSSCVRASYISESVKKLADIGYTNIELSGGTKPYQELESDLLRLKSEYNLNYLCHNYFPPPSASFVINLASLDENVFNRSLNHLKNAIELSAKLGADKYGFHAGFLINIPENQIGKDIDEQKLFDEPKAIEKFIFGFSELKKEHRDITLYLENNVISETNLKNFDGTNPFFICDHFGYEFFRKKIDFKILLDVAHLKVSCNSLNRNFEKELEQLLNETDYVHISDNDGKSDTNKIFLKNSELHNQLKKQTLKGKTFTLEVYSGSDDIKKSFETLAELI